jgi:hypothetical protein
LLGYSEGQKIRVNSPDSFIGIQALMSAPNPDDPLDNNVAEVWKSTSETLRRARRITGSFFAMKPAATFSCKAVTERNHRE